MSCDKTFQYINNLLTDLQNEMKIDKITFIDYYICLISIQKEFKITSNNLYECIKKFCNTEKMNGDNKIFCEKCKEKTYHFKKISLWKIPKYLLIHFKKFNSKMEKINIDINFPLNNLKIVTDTSREKQKYYLKGIIYHHGNRCFFGHYTCMIITKRKDMKKWRILFQ